MQNVITTPPPSDFEIDSFRLKIPYDSCNVLSTELEQLYLTINSNTSEIISERLNNRINVGTDYMKLWIQVQSQNARVESKDKGRKAIAPKKYIVVTVHSKLLGSRYLDRITMENVIHVYNAIMNYNVFYCDYHTFLHSDVLDIDFCRNVQISNWNECKSYILEHLKPTKQLNKGCYEFKSKDNVGLQFGTRDKSSYTAPYIKIYHKYLELTTKSILFTEKYLNDAIDIPNDLFRVEYTLRDKKHYKGYKIGSKLIDMLSLSSEKKEHIASHMFSFQFNEGIYAKNKPRVKRDLYGDERVKYQPHLLEYKRLGITTPKHLYIYLLLQSIKNYGNIDHNIELIIQELNSVGFDRRTLQRARKEIFTMFSKLPTKEQDAILDNENEYKRIMQSVMKSIELIGINESHYFGKNTLENAPQKIL
jgi:hypothetical protein